MENKVPGQGSLAATPVTGWDGQSGGRICWAPGYFGAVKYDLGMLAGRGVGLQFLGAGYHELSPEKDCETSFRSVLVLMRGLARKAGSHANKGSRRPCASRYTF